MGATVAPCNLRTWNITFLDMCLVLRVGCSYSMICIENESTIQICLVFQFNFSKVRVKQLTC